jgi:hypothetical protein
LSLREPKPAWREVPLALREKLATLVGDTIASADIVWGGYGPSATFALTTAAGKRFFCKGTHPGQTELGHQALLGERRNYERLPQIAQFGPAYLGGADHDDWHMAVLEHVPRAGTVPPWTDAAARQALALIARFHAAAPAQVARTLAPFVQSAMMQHEQGWNSLLNDAAARARFLALFEDAGAAGRWFARHGERFAELESQAASLGGPASWLHLDIRSDNLVFAENGRLVLVDWPMLAYGPVLFDVAAFLPSLEGEGGPCCAEGLRLYEQLSGIAFEPFDVATAVADVAGYFAARAGELGIAALPRLRGIQKLQLFPALRWLSSCLAIDEPPPGW